MTKESILDQYVKYAWECDQASPIIPYSEAEKAMDDWAARFGKWIQWCNYAPATEENKWQNQLPGENDIITTEELYSQFIEQQTKE